MNEIDDLRCVDNPETNEVHHRVSFKGVSIDGTHLIFKCVDCGMRMAALKEKQNIEGVEDVVANS